METALFQASIEGFFNLMHFEIWLAMMIGVGIGTFTAVTPQGLGTPLVYALMLPIVIKWEPLTGIALLIGASAVRAICAAYLPAGNSLERRGFHAPGLTGTFGAAVAAGRLLGLMPGEWSMLSVSPAPTRAA